MDCERFAKIVSREEYWFSYHFSCRGKGSDREEGGFITPFCCPCVICVYFQASINNSQKLGHRGNLDVHHQMNG